MVRNDRSALRRLEPGIIAQQVQPATPVISAQLIDIMFIGMCRSMPFFDEASRFLRLNHFYSWEAHYRVLYDVMCRLRPLHSSFCHTLLDVECRDYINADPTVCPAHLVERLLLRNEYGLLFMCFVQPESQINLTQCRSYLQRFLMERVVANPLRAFVGSVNQDATPTRLTEFLDVLHERRQQIQSVGTLPIVDVMPDPDQPIEAPSVYNLTGVSFIDRPLGGQREGDANGILGVTGSGKSTLAAYMGVQMARTEFARAVQENRQPRISVIFTYEEAARKMGPRIWSIAAQIRRDKLEQLTVPRLQLTTADNLEEYEHHIAGVGDYREGEYERWVKARGWLPSVLWVADMSGSEKFPNAGSGYVDEVVSVLEGIRAQSGDRAYLSILLDFAGLMCERYQHAQAMDESQLRHLLKGLGDRCRREISERYSCTTWIFHQIAPTHATSSPTKPLHHSMASESRAFAEFLAVCGCIGVPDSKTGCRLLNWSKTRYARTETLEPIPLRIHDTFASFEDVSDMYCVDHVGRSFVSTDVYHRICDGSEQEDTASTVARSLYQHSQSLGHGHMRPSVPDPDAGLVS